MDDFDYSDYEEEIQSETDEEKLDLFIINNSNTAISIFYQFTNVFQFLEKLESYDILTLIINTFYKNSLDEYNFTNPLYNLSYKQYINDNLELLNDSYNYICYCLNQYYNLKSKSTTLSKLTPVQWGLFCFYIHNKPHRYDNLTIINSH